MHIFYGLLLIAPNALHLNELYNYLSFGNDLFITVAVLILIRINSSIAINVNHLVFLVIDAFSLFRSIKPDYVIHNR